MKKKFAAALATAVLGFASSAMAVDTPKMLWVKAKCALCHGEDGAGNTPEGKNSHVPDLRAEAVQKRTDTELATLIAQGHSKMPAFHVQLDEQQIKMLVVYIRSIAPQMAKKK